MLSLLRAARSHRSIRPLPHIRHFAEEVTSRAIIDPSASSPSSSDDPNVQASPPALRDQESKISIPRDVPFVKVDDRHGLWHFFREFWNADQKEWQRTTVEFKNQDGVSGRSWSAAELRRKSFKDLHTLWYVLLRERNLLATQKEEARRLGIPSIGQQTDISWKVHQCKKSMARIKYVINERRLAYEGAVERFSQDKVLGKFGATAEREAILAKTKPAPKKVAGKTNGRTIGRRRPQRRATSITKEPEITSSPSQDAAPLTPSPPSAP